MGSNPTASIGLLIGFTDIGMLENKGDVMCKLCEEFYKRYPLEDGYHIIGLHKDTIRIKMTPIVCAFDKNGRFREKNWNCMTLQKLRQIATEHRDCYFHRNDMYAGTIYVLPVPEPDIGIANIQRGYIVLTCYKDRGAVDKAIVINEDEVQSLNLETAEWVIKAYKGRLALY